MNKKKILIIGFKDLKLHNRALRQIFHLKNQFEIHAVGFDQVVIDNAFNYTIYPEFKIMTLPKKILCVLYILTGYFKRAYQMMYNADLFLKQTENITFDLVIVHDLKPMPIVEKIRYKEILLDAHEFFFDMYERKGLIANIINKIDKYLINKYFKYFKHIITVCESIANEYKQLTNNNIDVIINAVNYYNLEPTLVNSDKIKIIHHGFADKNRRIERMIEMMEYTHPRFELHLMLTITTFEKPYINFLHQLVKNKSNIKILNPIPTKDIVSFINKYDIGLFILPNFLKNFEYALPNKFFEFIQARLMIAISPNKEMSNYVKKYQLGIVSPDFSAKTMAEMLNHLDIAQIQKYKNQSNLIAKELTSENEMIKLEKIISGII